ncbi:hypothetical protein BP6252_05193 [Coleophoma cylindrospora]|uniref:DNA mismatch repair protein n=1 Tax=Coleophoma cylindrospora TaxID=1849047 RepID=A0A3D8RT58_9HELO|nr:hypothetical protein BP6252_05193 [Coleophoma cylindrospora]
MAKSNSTPAKTQQSIASFFTKKTVNGTASSQTPQPSTKTVLESDTIGNIYDAGSDGDQSSSERLKRTLELHRHDGKDEIEPSAKRVKGNEEGQSALFSQTLQPRSTNSVNRPKPSSRTEKYLYTSSFEAPSDQEALDETEDTKKQKEMLHQKFVKKLGHPDSIAQLRRRNWETSEETPLADDDDDGDMVEEDKVLPIIKPKKGAKTGKLTPLEIQVLDIKRKHMDTLLIVEVGYKFKFYGEDARKAAKELSIVCIPGKFRYDEHPSEAHLDRFASASIPVHRLSVHAKRLVTAGYKIGIVRQIETAALKKAGDNRNTPFIRKLTNVYTKGTYIDDVDGLDQLADTPAGGVPATGYLLCITESKANGWGTDEKVEVGILAVQPATGDVIYDNFEDGFMRGEIETRILHIAPCEVLIVGELSKATEKLIQHLAGSSATPSGDKVRVERIEKPKTMAAESHSHVTQFYTSKNIKDDQAATLLEKILSLSEPVTICLSAMITHMTEYGLQHVFDLTKYFSAFSAKSHMILQGNTLNSLEIFQNQTDYAEKGSLFWTLNKTQTRFGQRLLRKWVGQPLLDRQRLEERVSAVEELTSGAQTPKVDKLRYLLRSIRSDLERNLLRIYYGKCTRPELLTALQTLQRIASEYGLVKTPADADFVSPLINEAIASLPAINKIIVPFLDKINPDAARKDDKYAFFREDSETEAIGDHKLGIAAVESELEAHRKVAASKLSKATPVTYATVSGIEYLIEVPNTDLKKVPASWAKISGTKKLSRFHTPDVIRMLQELAQHKESLSAACDVAFSSMLAEISQHYGPLRDSISSLSRLDCLLSLASVASLPGYCKPEFSTETEIHVVGGRHPMVEQLQSDGYIPNSTSLATANHSDPRALCVTGPNMGGKSSYCRQVALISIMAQIGSYVPADSARLGILDGVYTRMGAFDSIFTAQSTFMVELSETAAILKSASPRSLVILDELGRGTSTHDGLAIAGAVLDWIVRETKCLCLFITHYQALSSYARTFAEGNELKNVHMKFTAERNSDGEEEITFLYEVGNGVAHRSYGLNVAKLAKVPKAVIETAAVKSKELEFDVKQKKLIGLSKAMAALLSPSENSQQLEELIVGIEQL